MVDTTAGNLKQDVTVISVVSGGHFMSHYFTMMLPPLFPLLHHDLGVPYVMLGALLSAKSLASGSTQLPAGILVDRFGARKILIFGFTMMLVSYFLIAQTSSFWLIALLFMLSGIGNAVFHPADYSIMNGSISDGRIGRSFSAHTFAGHMGTAISPVVVLFAIGTLGLSWRQAIIVSVIVGVVCALAILSQWSRIQEGDTSRKKKKKAASESPGTEGGATLREPTVWQSLMEIVASKPMLFLFMFFALQALGSGGFKNFAVAGLVTLHGTSLAAAGGALTGFLFASAFGVLAGGFLADYDRRHALTASIALIITAGIAVVVGVVDLHQTVLVFLFTVAGLVQGVIRPARDMMIRAASPKGAIGKAFGFVFSGQAIGGTIAPLVFGALLDLKLPQWVFFCSAIFMLICMAAVLGSAHESRKQERAAMAA